MTEGLPEHVAANRIAWDGYAKDYVAAGERAWRRQPGEEAWGIFGVPESQVHVLPDDLAGRDAIELGCGTGYVSAWMARRGARVVGIDNSPNQLETARRLQREHGLDFPLILGNAETVPCPAASFDFAISEYGAALWADPAAWIPEAARLLRAGGRLVFLTNHVISYLCSPDREDDPVGDGLLRPMFGMGRTDWPDADGAVEFHLSHGDWIRLFDANGFVVEDLVEPRIPEGATTTYTWMTSEWARRWPCEEIWKVRRRARAATWIPTDRHDPALAVVPGIDRPPLGASRSLRDDMTVGPQAGSHLGERSEPTDNATSDLAAIWRGSGSPRCAGPVDSATMAPNTRPPLRGGSFA